MHLRLPGFSPSPPALPPPPPPPPTAEDPSIVEAREKARLSERRRKGRKSTIRTSGLGDQTEPNVNRPSLLRGSLGE